MHKIAVLTFLCLSVLCAPALAAPPGGESLAEIQKKLESEKARREDLAQKKVKIERDLAEANARLVDMAGSVQASEKAADEITVRIKGLEAQRDGLNESLNTDRLQMARLLLALERLRRAPPGALILRPGAPLKTAQSAAVLRGVLPALNARSEKLRADLLALSAVSKELEERQVASRQNAEKLRRENEDLKALLESRKDLYAQTVADLKERESNIKRISGQAADLKDLIRRLDDERGRDRGGRSPDAGRSVPFSPAPAAGSARLPVPGVILTAYNQPDAFGAPSRGITIEGRPGGLVVAPMGGVVRFAGSFRNYGQMIILEHAGGYHSLIAGFDRIDTVVGQNVSAGEPLGRMARNPADVKPTLYYELRLQGEPVNPARKFANLG